MADPEATVSFSQESIRREPGRTRLAVECFLIFVGVLLSLGSTSAVANNLPEQPTPPG